MKLTIYFIERNFDHLNNELFSGKIVKPKFMINRTRSCLGMCCWKSKTDDKGNLIARFDYRIKISEYFDRSETDYINTILHEMIHLYIRQNDLAPDNEHHGRTCRNIADRVNRHGYNVKYSDSCEGLGLNDKNTVFFMTAFMDRSGRHFVIRYNPKYFEYFRYNFGLSGFTKVIWFTSTDDRKYGHLPKCRKRAGGMQITEGEYDELTRTVSYRENA